MKRIIIFGLILGSFILSSCCSNSGTQTTEELVAKAKSEINLITPEQLFDIMDKGEEIFTLIDVRTAMEYYPGYIPGAVLINRGSLEFKILSASFWENAGLYMPKKDEKVILYCKKGNRGALAAQTLQKMGFTNVYYLKGGFKNWELTYPDWVEKNLEAMGGGGQTHDMGGGC